MRIALLCNDRVALPSLDYLANAGLLVAVGVSSKRNEIHSVITSHCAKANIPVTVFLKRSLEADLTQWLHDAKADVVLVKTFPYLVPASVLQIPKHGFINFHYAPLPMYRGANPLFWMIRNRVEQGGVTVHEMSANYDEGPILLQQPLQIAPSVNFGILYTQLSFMGLQMTNQLVMSLQNGGLQKKEQDHSQAKWYAQPKTTDLSIDWQNMEAEDITALVRACNPWNKGAATSFNGWTFGITYASVDEMPAHESKNAGTVLSIDPSAGFAIACKNGKKVIAEVVYCEEGYYPGYCMSAFGLQINQQLS